MSKIRFMTQTVPGSNEATQPTNIWLEAFNAENTTWIGALQHLATKFSTHDFASVAMNSSIPIMYGDNGSALKRAEAYSKASRSIHPTAAFTVHQKNRGNPAPVGMASFAYSGPRFKDNGTRQAVSWFDNSQLLPGTTEKDFADASMDALVRTAHLAGVTLLSVLVSPELDTKNEALTVIEHTIDPTEHGFIVIRDEVVMIEQQQYVGKLWQLPLRTQ